MRSILFVVALFVVAMHSASAASNLFLFKRQFEIRPDDCAKTYKIDFPTQGSCLVELWPDSFADIQFEPSRLINIWRYLDEDLEVFVTIERALVGYAIRVNVNSDKYSDRLPYAVSEKYIRAALEDHKIQMVTTLVARGSSTKSLHNINYTENELGLLGVYERRVELNSPALFQACKTKWRGFQCVLSFLRNKNGETLLSEVSEATLRGNGLTLDLRSQPGWQNGSAFSAVTLTFSSDRFVSDLAQIQSQFSLLVKDLRPLRFLVTQVEGDDAPDAPYSQALKARLQAVQESIVLDKMSCSQSYQYLENQFKGVCEVRYKWPGVLAQNSEVLSQFVNIGIRSSFVNLSLTRNGYSIQFSGARDSVGDFAGAEEFFDEINRVLIASPIRKTFLTY